MQPPNKMTRAPQPPQPRITRLQNQHVELIFEVYLGLPLLIIYRFYEAFDIRCAIVVYIAFVDIGPSEAFVFPVALKSVVNIVFVCFEDFVGLFDALHIEEVFGYLTRLLLFRRHII